MILCLDAGNSQIFAGIFTGDIRPLLNFRMESTPRYRSDQYGIFIRNVLRENAIDWRDIKGISFCSVVPRVDYSILAACKKYLKIEPFILKAGVKTGLKIKYRNPLEVGADRIANAIGATRKYPNKPIIIVDFGTATTICAIDSQRTYLGGVIVPGMRLSMEALETNTSKLSSVPIVHPEGVIGRSTAESIQTGLYWGQRAAVQAITGNIIETCFSKERDKPLIIGTGGFSHFFSSIGIFDEIEPDLVLHGLRIALQENQVCQKGNGSSHKE